MNVNSLTVLHRAFGVVLLAVAIAGADDADLKSNAQPQFPADVEGWSRSRWGMTEENVLKTFTGEARLLEKPGHFKDGSFSSIEIESLRIGDDIFRVGFTFDGESKTLIRVSLTAHVDKKRPMDGSLVFERISVLLVSKYGQPSTKKEEKKPVKVLTKNVSIGGDIKSDLTWIFPSTVVSLNHTYMKNILNWVIISYRKNRKEDLDKL